jgi:hypothetical protein
MKSFSRTRARTTGSYTFLLSHLSQHSENKPHFLKNKGDNLKKIGHFQENVPYIFPNFRLSDGNAWFSFFFEDEPYEDLHKSAR